MIKMNLNLAGCFPLGSVHAELLAIAVITKNGYSTYFFASLSPRAQCERTRSILIIGIYIPQQVCIRIESARINFFATQATYLYNSIHKDIYSILQTLIRSKWGQMNSRSSGILIYVPGIYCCWTSLISLLVNTLEDKNDLEYVSKNNTVILS